MELFKTNSTIDFMAQSKAAFAFSILIFIFSMSVIAVRGLNMGLDFTGGTQIEIHYAQPAALPHIRDQLSEAGFPNAVVQAYGSSHDVLVRLAPQQQRLHTPDTPAGVTRPTLKQQITHTLHEGQIRRVEFIGPQVGQTLITNGILAIIISMIATMLYIAVRFEYRFAASAALSLIHDPILILGIFSLFQLEFNLIALAAMLTILGYSLNDTIVVYDRVRENFRTVRNLPDPNDIMNLSINQTLSRTIMTSGLTLVVVIALCVFGGETLRSFSIALIIGILIGTYSSIYIAGALALRMGLNRTSLMPPEKKPWEDAP